MQWSDRAGRRLKLRDLHILLAVAKTGSMGKAAADLAISQPSVSKAIADIEHAVGVRVLDRSPRGIALTIYGRALIKCGVAVFDDLRQGVKELEFLIDPAIGELRIGCSETLAAGYVSAVIDRLSQQYPRATFHLVPGDAMTLLNRELRERTLDLIVIAIAGLDPAGDVDIEILFDDHFVVMAGTQSRWLRRRKLALAELINEHWILPPSDSVPGRHIAEMFRASALEPPHAHIVSFSLPLHHHLLAVGRFVTWLPESMLRFGKHLPLRLLPIDTPRRPYPIAILTLKDRTLHPLAEVFIKYAREVAKPLTRRH